MTCDKAATIDEKNTQVALANKLKELAIEQYPKLHPFKASLANGGSRILIAFFSTFVIGRTAARVFVKSVILLHIEQSEIADL